MIIFTTMLKLKRTMNRPKRQWKNLLKNLGITEDRGDGYLYRQLLKNAL